MGAKVIQTEFRNLLTLLVTSSPKMLYAVVDIETTGGNAATGGITEIAVLITDGVQVVDRFHTLLNPYYTIPRYIEVLTGITNYMVEDAPDFMSIADELYELLHDKIFVAHNVNFDYSFIHHYLLKCGHTLNCKKLCTIRLGRKIMPGLPGYGLEKICNHLQIYIKDRHRAMGDAEATVILFHHLLKNDLDGHANKMLKGNGKEQFLPPNVSAKEFSALPNRCGIYYFLDKKQKVIYVGKAKNLRKRVNSHFSNNKTDEKKQEFLKKIYHVTYQETGTELMAFILENIEIKRLWPKQNSSQKRFEPSYALYTYVDGRGYMRLCVEKMRKHLTPVRKFNRLAEGYSTLYKCVQEFGLKSSLCFLQKPSSSLKILPEEEMDETPEAYNEKVSDCIAHLQKELMSYAVLDSGLKPNERSCILVEKGRFYGMGYLSQEETLSSIEEMKDRLTPYPDNDYIQSLIDQHIAEFPYRKKILQNKEVDYCIN